MRHALSFAKTHQLRSVTVTSVLRLYFISRVWYAKSEDIHCSLGYTLSTIEMNLAIVTATIPTLWHWSVSRSSPCLNRWGRMNRPYLYPDMELGYVSLSPVPVGGRRAEGRRRRRIPARALRRGLRLPRPRALSCIRTTTERALAGGGSSAWLTDIREQKVFGAPAVRGNRSAVGNKRWSW
jgi:hypothetical protein